jgi:hypothetical protein
VLCCSQDHLRTRTHDIDHPVLAGVENIDSWHARKGDLQRAFPLDVPMVPSSPLAATANGECLSRDDFSLGETIRFGSLDFITDCFGGRSLSPWRDGSDVTAVGSTCSGPLLSHPEILISECEPFFPQET